MCYRLLQTLTTFVKERLMANLWEKFPQLTKRVWEDHGNGTKAYRGHDFFHALLVAQYCQMIAEDERTGVLGWIAAMCHNIDRFFPREQEEKIAREYLELADGLAKEEKELIVDAVLHHSGLNSPSDNPVTVLLKDGDRLAGAGILCPIRAGQTVFEGLVFDPRYLTGVSPGSTFQNIKTVLDGMKFTLEWQEMLRCPKAIELGKRWFGVLKQAILDSESQIKKTGIGNFQLPE